MTVSLILSQIMYFSTKRKQKFWDWNFLVWDWLFYLWEGQSFLPYLLLQRFLLSTCILDTTGYWLLGIVTRTIIYSPSRILSSPANASFPPTFKHTHFRTSPVAQWLRTCLPMQGTRVRALVREDSTCRGATKPVRHSYWACALEPTATTTEPMCRNYWSLHE